MTYELNALTAHCRAAHMRRNIYTGPDDVMLCAKPNVLTVVRKQVRQWLLLCVRVTIVLH